MTCIVLTPKQLADAAARIAANWYAASLFDKDSYVWKSMVETLRLTLIREIEAVAAVEAEVPRVPKTTAGGWGGGSR